MSSVIAEPHGRVLVEPLESRARAEGTGSTSVGRAASHPSRCRGLAVRPVPKAADLFILDTPQGAHYVRIPVPSAQTRYTDRAHELRECYFATLGVVVPLDVESIAPSPAPAVLAGRFDVPVLAAHWRFYSFGLAARPPSGSA